MDVAGLSIYMKQGQLASKVVLAVTKKAMDVSQDNALQMIKMLEMSVNPNLGANIDTRV